jgi:micrococcal nuclease
MRYIILCLCVFPLVIFGADPDTKVVTLKGKVVRISDGDTIGILIGKETVKVRLEGIDAPESNQAFGTKAKNALNELVAGKEVVVKKTGEDRYKRTLGTVYVGETDVNAKLIHDGWAWHYKQYSKDKALAKLETEAKEAKRGLWADPNALEPWEFRKRSKLKDSQEAGETAGAGKTVESPETAKTTEKTSPAQKYWLNTSGNVRHNESCQYFNNTKKGRFCEAGEGRACGKCGG